MIYLLSNCTSSKRLVPEENMLIKNYSFNDINTSINEWKKNSESTTSNVITANELYKGHSWQETLKNVDILSQISPTKLLISSAGYGLINSDQKINSYQATFSKGNENSIYNFKNDSISTPTTIWWDRIDKFDISKLDESAYVFINVSYEYLIAMQNTIKQLIDIFKDKLFIIVLSKNKLPDFYTKNILRFDTRFNSFENGTISSIIPRFSRWLFKEIVDKSLEFDNKEIQKHINNFLSKFSKYELPNRKQLTDENISNLIIKQIQTKNIRSKSSGLKDLRSQGYACSQERYGKLYTKVKDK